MATDAEKLEQLGITKVANAKAGHSPIKQAISVNSDLMFEPEAENIEIPSKNYLYRDILKDNDALQNGYLKIRPMTVNEEKILTTNRLVKTGQALDLIFSNCIKTDIDPAEILSSDRVFIMLWLRKISYGEKYRFWVQSQDPSNQSRFEWEIDLNTIGVKSFNDPEIREPFTTKLPSGYEITFRLPRGKDELEIIKMGNQPKGMDSTDETIVKRLSSIIIEAKLKDGKVIPPTQYDSFINSLITRDASAFREAIDEIDCGIDDIEIIDPQTGYTWTQSIPITASFFATSNK
jgi:hypothetical protein